MLFVRENSEGEYSGVGGRVAPGPSRRGRHRDGGLHARGHRARRRARVRARGASGAAWSRARPSRTPRATATCSGTRSPPRWPRAIPDVRYERVLVDALAARMVLRPDSLDVVVASNLFGDILTDLGAALQGGMGMAASANLCPGGDVPGALRAGARLGARHRRPGHREPVRRRLERRPDARPPRRGGRLGAPASRRSRASAARARARATSAAAPTTDRGRRRDPRPHLR